MCQVSVRREGRHAVRYVRGILLFVGAVANLGIVWLIADILNAVMAIPNLIALLALCGTIPAVTKTYFERERASD